MFGDTWSTFNLVLQYMNAISCPIFSQFPRGKLFLCFISWNSVKVDVLLSYRNRHNSVYHYIKNLSKNPVALKNRTFIFPLTSAWKAAGVNAATLSVRVSGRVSAPLPADEGVISGQTIVAWSVEVLQN